MEAFWRSFDVDSFVTELAAAITTEQVPGGRKNKKPREPKPDKKQRKQQTKKVKNAVTPVGEACATSKQPKKSEVGEKQLCKYAICYKIHDPSHSARFVHTAEQVIASSQPEGPTQTALQVQSMPITSTTPHILQTSTTLLSNSILQQCLLQQRRRHKEAQEEPPLPPPAAASDPQATPQAHEKEKESRSSPKACYGEGPASNSTGHKKRKRIPFHQQTLL